MGASVNSLPRFPLDGILGGHSIDAILLCERSDFRAGCESGPHFADDVLSELRMPIALPVGMPKVCDRMGYVLSDGHDPKVLDTVIAAVEINMVDMPSCPEEGLGDNPMDPFTNPSAFKAKNDFVVAVFLDRRSKRNARKRPVDSVDSPDNSVDGPHSTERGRLVHSVRGWNASPFFRHNYPPIDYRGTEERWER